MTEPKWLQDLESLERAATPGPWPNIGREGWEKVPDIPIAVSVSGERNYDLMIALRNRAPQILRALRAAMEMRNEYGPCDSDCPGESIDEFERMLHAFDAAMQDGEPTLRDAEKEGK